MTLLTEVGDSTRFRTEAPFARWCGTAPVATSSGEATAAPSDTLDLAGNRQVNSILHIVRVTQARMHEPAKNYLTRRNSDGKTPREARRCHKRQLANVIIRRMWNDAECLSRSTPSSRAAA